MRVIPPVAWPENRPFAFTIVDDTDRATKANVGPIYALLADLGMRTTKTVWPLDPTVPSPLSGSSLEDEEYREWVLSLQRDGFEIAYHGTSDESSERATIIRGLDAYRAVLGEDPRVYAAHTGQKEAMYWGRKRLAGLERLTYDLLNAVAGRSSEYLGDDDASPYFWGDVCRSRITYTRGFTFSGIDTLRADPFMPYHDPRQPYVNRWFSSSDGYTGGRFNTLISEGNQDALAAAGGCCIVYTHFGFGFCEGGRVNATTRRLLERLATLGGWFVPAATILDHLATQPGRGEELSRSNLALLQRRWLAEQLGAHNWARFAKRFHDYRVVGKYG